MYMGLRLRSIRTMMGMTQDELAKKVGVNRSAIQKYESGIVENVPVRTLEALAEALEVAPQDLMGWSETSVTRNQHITLAGVRRMFGAQYEELILAFHKLDSVGQGIGLRIIHDLDKIYGESAKSQNNNRVTEN